MKLFGFSLIFLLTFVMSVAPVHSEEVTEEQTESASDYIGVSLEIPDETQKLIGLKTEKVESSKTAEKIPVTGRIAQDAEQVIEVFAPEAGIVKECPAPIGSVVSKGQVICVIESKDSKSLMAAALFSCPTPPNSSSEG